MEKVQLSGEIAWIEKALEAFAFMRGGILNSIHVFVMEFFIHKRSILVTILLVIFLDFFNLGLIYPLFSSLIFDTSGQLLPLNASEFYKNVCYGALITIFPFGQFFGAPIIGQLSDHFGRRKLLIISLIGTVITLLISGLGVYSSSLLFLFLGRFVGGLMAGNLTLAYALLADSSDQDKKVRVFALMPFTMSAGFALGPFLAGILANPESSSWSGPTIPFLAAALFSFVNLLLVVKKFPKDVVPEKKSIKNDFFSGLRNLSKIAMPTPERPLLWILFLMISSNFLFLQFLGPYATEKFHINVTGLGYLYTNIGLGAALGNLFLTRWLAKHLSVKKALACGLSCLAILLVLLPFLHDLITLHALTFLIMLACAVGYTNAMALVSNHGDKDRQGETMGVAVAIQSCSEFLPALLIAFIAAGSGVIPLLIAAFCALFSYLILRKVNRVSVAKQDN